jgi:hypothetical protein
MIRMRMSAAPSCASLAYARSVGSAAGIVQAPSNGTALSGAGITGSSLRRPAPCA